MNSDLRVVIVDDHPLARKGIASILLENKKNQVILEASNSKEAMEIIKNEKVDIVLVDLKLGKEDGLDIVVKGKELIPKTKFIIITSFLHRTDFFRAEEIGVDGYILKEASTEDINYIIDMVRRGKKYYDPQIIMYYKNDSAENSQMNQLTKKEKEVLLELAKGLSNGEIAGKLYISGNTVKKHVSNILLKLNLRHRTQAALFINNINN